MEAKTSKNNRISVSNMIKCDIISNMLQFSARDKGFLKTNIK